MRQKERKGRRKREGREKERKGRRGKRRKRKNDDALVLLLRLGGAYCHHSENKA